MAAATRLGDYCTGHDSCSPTALQSGSPNVNINSCRAGRVGDGYGSHGCLIHSSHADSIAAGSATVFINGRPAARVGDAVTLAGSVRDGSGNVFIGG